LVAPPNFLRKSIIFPYLFKILLLFFEIFCTSLSCRALCAHRLDFHFLKIWQQEK
jgi:hypothetical protein